MAKFNTQKPTSKTENLAGGEAYKETPKLELVGNLLTSFVQNQYYRSEKEGADRLKKLIQDAKDKVFIAKAAIFARNKFGMRSITHITAGEVAKGVKGEKWTKNFYDKVVHRPDDITEILSYYLTNYKKPIPNSLKKGLRQAIGKFDEYQISKYKGNNKGLKMVDVVNLLHPKDSDAKILKRLVEGTLQPPNTWEVQLTQAGQKAETEEQKAELKKDAWKTLIKERKIGYFALLKNLRNILEQAPEMAPDACALLTNEKLISKSLVLPFRFTTAIEEIEKVNAEGSRDVLMALNKAIDISVKNVPTFKGKTLIVTDHSGSMNGRPIRIASLFMAILAKSNNADCMIFGDNAKYVPVNPVDSTLTIAKQIEGYNQYVGWHDDRAPAKDYCVGHGTNFHSVFRTANKAYDRIVILSDMQGWVEYRSPTGSLKEYKAKHNANPFVYSWNVADYGTLMFPENNVFCLAGWSEKVFDIMKLLESDRKALITEIEKVEL